MALLFLDSFDHINSVSLLPRKWSQVKNSSGLGLVSPGRSGSGNALQVTNSSFVLFNFPNTSVGPTIGCAVQFNTFNSFFLTMGGPQTTNLGTLDLTLWHVGDGRIFASIYGRDVNAPPSQYVFHIGQWYYLELHGYTFATGTQSITIGYDLHVNGVSVYAGTITIMTATMNPTVIWNAGGIFSSSLQTYDDFYMTDGEFLGDIRNLPLWRIADGDALQWTPNIAGAHYLMVEDQSPDDNATYIASSTPGQEDMGTMTQISGVTGTIKGIQGIWDGSVQAGGDSVQGGYKSSGVTQLAANPFPVAPYTQYSLDPQRKSVFTGVDWTIAEINAMQLDVKKVA